MQRPNAHTELYLASRASEAGGLAGTRCTLSGKSSARTSSLGSPSEATSLYGVMMGDVEQLLVHRVYSGI